MSLLLRFLNVFLQSPKNHDFTFFALFLTYFFSNGASRTDITKLAETITADDALLLSLLLNCDAVERR